MRVEDTRLAADLIGVGDSGTSDAVVLLTGSRLIRGAVLRPAW
ncbi:hypothetical protein [Halobacterium salinarum]|nr:hypothetical protein [Halobacterium salinarum]